MKILFDPAYTNKETEKCISHYKLKSLAMAVSDLATVYYVTPSNTNDFTEPELPESFVKIPMFCYRDRYKEFFVMKKEWVDNFALWGKYWDWDILVTTKVVPLPMMKLLASKNVYKGFFVQESFPVMSFKKTVAREAKIGDMMCLAGYLESDLTIVNAGHEKDGIMEVARQYLSPKKILELDEKIDIKFNVSKGIDTDKAYKRAGADNPKKLNVLYCQRLDESQRRCSTVFKIFEKAFALNYPISFEVTTNSQGGADWNKKFKFIRFSSPKREKYWERLKESQVFLTWSVEEGWPHGLMEATTHGLIGIAKREPWSEHFFGKQYPWLVNKEDQALALLKSISRDWKSHFEIWMNWYKSYFQPLIKRNGRMSEKFREFVIQKDKEIGSWCHDKVSDHGSMVSTIDKNMKMMNNGHCNLMDTLKRLDRWKEVYQNFESDDYGQVEHIPLSRCPHFYELRRKLMFMGYKDGRGVGDLVLPR